MNRPHWALSWRPVFAVLLLYGVPIAGLAILVATARDLPLQRWPDVLLFAALCAISQLMPVRLFRSSTISVASAAAFAGLVWLGPAAGVWIGLGSSLVMGFRPRRKPLQKMAYNAGVLAIAAQVAGWLYVEAGGAVGHPRLTLDMLLPIVVSVTARYCINTGLVAAAIALTTNSSLRTIWETNFRWLAALYLGLGLIGFGMAVATDQIGLLGLTIALVPLAIAWYAYKLYVAEAEQARLRSEELQLTKAMLSASPDLMLRLDPSGKILGGNAGDASVLAAAPEELIGRSVDDLLSPELIDPTHQHIARTLQSGTMQVFEFQMPTHDGTGEFEARLVVSGDQEVLAIVRDNTARKELERQLAHQAFHDGLTGLPNRVLFMDRLGHALVRAARSRKAVAVLFLDLDRFKVINDSLGHDVGDQLLVAVSQQLARTIRGGDTVARLGGDEFTVLLEDIADPTEARAVAERIMAALQTPFALAGHEVCITTSIGIAFSASGQTAAEDLVRDADAAMYRGKSTGKARYEVYDSTMHARALERLELEADLRRGIERGELRVHYQPKIELATGRIAGVEALVRWQHPTRGLIPPADFVSLAEETGLILPLGRYVLAEACRQARCWQERYPDRAALTVSVNLSVRQFQHPSLVDDVDRVLRQTGLEPGRLELEITEGIVMEAAEASSAALQRLKDLGIRLAIDDFGTGYSSLSYLKRFPVDMLKIDRSFVDGLGRDPGDAAIIHAVTGLAHTLGLQVTAEGIETAEQLVRLQRTGCDFGQGYHFSRPLTADATDALLADGSRLHGARLALVG